MKRFLSHRVLQRGTTATGYSLLMAGLVVTSLTALEAVDRAAQTVLVDTAQGIGDPMPTLDELRGTPAGGNSGGPSASPSPPPTAAPPTAPPATTPPATTPPATTPPATTPPGTTPPGTTPSGGPEAPVPSSPIGQKLPFSADDYEPDKVQGDGKWHGSAENRDLTSPTLKDNKDVFVFLESVVELSAPWTPPSGDEDGDPGPVPSNAGDRICTYLVHASPLTKSDVKYDFKLKFEGDIVGTAHSSNFNTGGGVFAAEGATYPADNSLDSEKDDFEIKVNDKKGDEFKGKGLETQLGDYTQIRIFVRC